MKKFIFYSFAVFICIQVTGPLLMLLSGNIRLDGDWTRASRASANIAPDPASNREAVIQVYSARAFNWRGLFAVHTWIAIKEKNANQFYVHHVLGWNKRRGLPVVVTVNDIPDRLWYGYTPEITRDIRGVAAEQLIPEINAAVSSYPYPHDYTAWPGPNSNTFTAHIGRKVPGLNLVLPPVAIGKDYLVDDNFFDNTPDSNGLQISLLGIAGIALSKSEGIEVNFMGQVTGIDFDDKAIKIPAIGRVAVF